MGKKVFIGVGHGGNDSGAVGLKDILEKKYKPCSCTILQR